MNDEKKSITKALDDFSKRLAAAEKSKENSVKEENDGKQKINFEKIPSQNKNLQESINEREEKRTAALRSQMNDFMEPRTKDIESDEENLMKAYELFCKVTAANKETGDAHTHLKDFSIISPLCKKAEYTTAQETYLKDSTAPHNLSSSSQTQKHTAPKTNRFSFLRLWFLAKNPDSEFVPIIESCGNQNKNDGYALTFLEKELWKPTIFEKEILQACSEEK